MMLETVLCPICGKAIVTRNTTPIYGRASMPSRTPPEVASRQLTAMMLAAQAEHLDMVRTTEEACVEHFRSEHPWRLWLWRKTRWQRFMNRRWFVWGRKLDYEQFKVHP